MFILMVIQKSAKVEIKQWNVKQDIELSWANGMIGAIPVFDTMEAAEKYRGNTDIPIFEVVLAKMDESSK